MTNQGERCFVIVDNDDGEVIDVSNAAALYFLKCFNTTKRGNSVGNNNVASPSINMMQKTLLVDFFQAQNSTTQWEVLDEMLATVKGMSPEEAGNFLEEIDDDHFHSFTNHRVRGKEGKHAILGDEMWKTYNKTRERRKVRKYQAKDPTGKKKSARSEIFTQWSADHTRHRHELHVSTPNRPATSGGLLEGGAQLHLGLADKISATAKDMAKDMGKQIRGMSKDAGENIASLARVPNRGRRSSSSGIISIASSTGVASPQAFAPMRPGANKKRNKKRKHRDLVRTPPSRLRVGGNIIGSRPGPKVPKAQQEQKNVALIIAANSPAVPVHQPRRSRICSTNGSGGLSARAKELVAQAKKKAQRDATICGIFELFEGGPKELATIVLSCDQDRQLGSHLAKQLQLLIPTQDEMNNLEVICQTPRMKMTYAESIAYEMGKPGVPLMRERAKIMRDTYVIPLDAKKLLQSHKTMTATLESMVMDKNFKNFIANVLLAMHVQNVPYNGIDARMIEFLAQPIPGYKSLIHQMVAQSYDKGDFDFGHGINQDAFAGMDHVLPDDKAEAIYGYVLDAIEAMQPHVTQEGSASFVQTVQNFLVQYSHLPDKLDAAEDRLQAAQNRFVTAFAYGSGRNGQPMNAVLANDDVVKLLELVAQAKKDLALEK